MPRRKKARYGREMRARAADRGIPSSTTALATASLVSMS